MSLFRNCCAAALCVAVLADQLSAATVSYCVREVGVVRQSVKGLAVQSRGPTRFLLGNQAPTPLAVDELREPAEEPGRYYPRKILWSFGADRRFHGPNPITTFDVDGTDGRYIYLSTQRQLPPEKNQKYSTKWDSHFYYVENGGEPQKITLPLAGRNTQYLIHRHAMRDNGLVLTSSVERPGKSIEQQQWLVRGPELTPLPQWLAYPQYRFDRWGLSVGTAADQVYLRDLRTGARTDVDVRSTDDEGGIESVNVDRYGWLFVENWGSDYAIKWQRDGGRIAIDHVVRYTGRGFWGRLFTWLLGTDKGLRVEETHSSAQCVDFSPVVQLTIFCKPAKVLRNGSLERIGDGSAPLKRYLADAAGAGVALLGGTDGGLYAFDGTGVQRVARGIGSVGFKNNVLFPQVLDLPAARRTFITGRDSWELVGRFPHLRLRAIHFNGPQGRQTTASQFISFPNSSDVLAFSSVLGVWRLGHNDAQLIWRTGSEAIDLNSITPAAVWNGILFSTLDKRNYLLSTCR